MNSLTRRSLSFLCTLSLSAHISSLPAAYADETPPPVRRAPKLREEAIFRGTIGGRSRIRMKLYRSGDELSGILYDERDGKPIAISGRVTDSDSIDLDEQPWSDYPGDRARLGHLQGEFKGDGFFEGRWTGRRNQSAGFRLKLDPPVEHKAILERDVIARDDDACHVRIEYPQIKSGIDEKIATRINQDLSEGERELRSRAADTPCRKGYVIHSDERAYLADHAGTKLFTETNDLSIGWFREKLLSVVYDQVLASAPGRPMGARGDLARRRAWVFDLQTGQVLGVRALFQGGLFHRSGATSSSHVIDLSRAPGFFLDELGIYLFDQEASREQVWGTEFIPYPLLIQSLSKFGRPSRLAQELAAGGT